VAWGVGLQRNLAANWSLLARTGASTNVVSKAARDAARAIAAGPRACRFAASAGYLLAEAAKEVPYYAGASGVAPLSDSVSAGDAITFLGGTNLGAAVYEYGLACATRTYLRHAAVEEQEPSVAPRAAASAAVPAGGPKSYGSASRSSGTEAQR
jgi:hypothetical protein